MNKPIKLITQGILDFLILVVLTLLTPLIVIIDVKFFSDRVSEISLTEFTQEFVLFITVLIFYYLAWQHKPSRGFHTLVAGFFCCMLVRELDGILDQIWSGFWFWPALFVAVCTLIYVLMFCRDTITTPMSEFINTKPYYYLSFGLINVLVFSQSFGSRSIVWKHTINSNFSYLIRNILQEGLELYGYIFIFYATCLYVRSLKSKKEPF